MAVAGLQILFAQMIRPQVTWILLSLGCAQVWFLRKDLSGRKQTSPCWRWDEKTMFTLCILIAISNGLSALTPEVREDPLQYHIAFPSLYVIHGGFYENAWHYFSYMPIHVESLYALALSIGRDHLAKLIHCSFGILVAFLLFCFARRMHSRKAGLWSAWLWMITPQVAWLSSACFIDLAQSAWVTVSLLSITQAAQQTDHSVRNRWLLMAAISSGFFLGAKYTTALIAFVPLCLVWLVWLGTKQRLSTRGFWKQITFLTVPAAVIASPVFIKNWILTGNPFFPILAGVLGRNRPGLEITHAHVMDHTPPAAIFTPLGFLKWFAVRWTGVNYAGTFVLNLAAIALLTTLLMLLCRRQNWKEFPQWIRFHVLFIAAAWVMNLLCCNNMDGRFFLPIVPAICVQVSLWLCCEAWGHLPGGRQRLRPLLLLCLVVLSLFGFIMERSRFAETMNESLVPVLTESARSQYYKDRIPKYDVVEYVNANLPQDSCILSIGYPARRRTIGTACGAPNPVNAAIGTDTYTADDLLRAFRLLGVTHFVHPGSNALQPEAVDGLIEQGLGKEVFRSEQGYALFAIANQ